MKVEIKSISAQPTEVGVGLSWAELGNFYNLVWKDLLDAKNFLGPKKFGDKQIWEQNKSWVQKCFVQKNIPIKKINLEP